MKDNERRTIYLLRRYTIYLSVTSGVMVGRHLVLSVLSDQNKLSRDR